MRSPISKLKEADRFEPSSDILRQAQQRPLDCIFSPKSIAVIGATESAGSVGRTLLENLRQGRFAGTIYPVNPKRQTVLGIKAYPSILAAPDKVDLAVIVTPAVDGARTHPAIARNAGVSGAIIISAGFKEIGAAGVELERQILAEARGPSMRIVGPNCLGVMTPRRRLNATFAAAMARPGSVGFLSQSGALCTAMLDWSLQRKCRVQRVRLARFDARRGLGRFDLSPRRRSRTPRASSSTWNRSATRARSFRRRAKSR